MPNIEMPAENNALSKVKLATAIKIVKDSVEQIKKAGYDVSIEEQDAEGNYQILIKVQK